MEQKPPFLHLQRVLAGLTPDQVVAELTTKPAMAKVKPSERASPCDITKTRLIAESAEEVSQPDTLDGDGTLLETFYAPRGRGCSSIHSASAR